MASRHSLTPCFLVLDDACWAALLRLVGGEEKRGETTVPCLGSKEGHGRGRGQREALSSASLGHPTDAPTHVGLVKPGEAEAGLKAAQLQEGRLAVRQRWLLKWWLPAGAILERLDVSLKGLVASRSAKTNGVGGHSPAHTTKAALLDLCSAPLPAGPGRKARGAWPPLGPLCC